VAAFAVILALAYGVGPVEWIDGNTLNGFVTLRGTWVEDAANWIAATCDPGPYTLLVAIVVVYALVKRGPRRAAAIGLLLVGANMSSQVLKPLLAHQRDLSAWPAVDAPSSAAFPSGHATAAMALAFAIVLATPRAYRPVAATISGLFALAVAISVVVLNWHYPSDVFGGQLVASFWCLIALAGLRWSEERWPARGQMAAAARDAFPAPSRAAVAAILLAVVVVGATQAAAIASFVKDHTTAVAAVAAIAASGAVLIAGVTALATRR
jgi:membrane-associated phospholipid phosphatase